MTPGARIAAAIEVIADIEARRRPAADALKDWGLAHRFAGSGDRAAIAGLTYDTLRRRASSAFIMGGDSPRAIVLGMLRLERGLDADAIARLADGVRHSPAPLDDAERARLDAADLSGAPPWVAGDYPEWLDPYLARVFGDERAEEAARWRAVRRSTCASIRSRATATARRPSLPTSSPRRRAGRRSGCGSCTRRTPRRPRSMPSPPSSRA